MRNDDDDDEEDENDTPLSMQLGRQNQGEQPIHDLVFNLLGISPASDY
jgi:hypothetical protein